MVAFLHEELFPFGGRRGISLRSGEVALDSARGWILLDEKKIFNSELLSFGFQIDMDPMNLRQRKFLIVFFREVAFL